MEHRKYVRLGEFLVGKGLISEEELSAALKIQAATKELLGAIIVKSGYIKERELLRALSEHFGIPLARLKDRYLNWDIVTKFSPSLILEHRFFPVEADDISVTVAVTDPLDVWGLKKLKEEAKELDTSIVLVSEEDMDEAIGRYRAFMRDRLNNML
jgi:hypothetical protein